MQPKLGDADDEALTCKRAKTSSSIISHGKLRNSSYYEASSGGCGDQEECESGGRNVSDDEQTPPLPTTPPTSESLEVGSCVFSHDNRFLAWSCGYGIVKIMKWEQSIYCKKPTASSSPPPPTESIAVGKSILAFSVFTKKNPT